MAHFEIQKFSSSLIKLPGKFTRQWCRELLFTCISLQKTADAYADDFESEISKATPRPQPQVQSPTDKQTDKLRPSPLSPLGTSALRRNTSSASESIAEESIAESIQSVQVRIRG